MLGSSREALEEHAGSVELAGRSDCDYCMPYEDDLPIWLVRDPDVELARAWPELKHYD